MGAHHAITIAPSVPEFSIQLDTYRISSPYVPTRSNYIKVPSKMRHILSHFHSSDRAQLRGFSYYISQRPHSLERLSTSDVSFFPLDSSTTDHLAGWSCGYTPRKFSMHFIWPRYATVVLSTNLVQWWSLRHQLQVPQECLSLPRHQPQ